MTTDERDAAGEGRPADDAEPSQPQDSGAVEADAEDDRFTLLEAFGLRLEVSNPRLADLLTMDAKDALTSDVRDLVDPENVREVQEEAAEAVPDTLLTPVSGRDEVETRDREAMRAHATLLGEQLGFLARADGVWESPTGVHILTRALVKQISYAAASHYVEELKERRESLCGRDCSVLFITADQQTADVFKVAIRQGEQFDMMRTVSIDNLESISSMYAQGGLDHSQAIVLLAPIANIDVGELLAVLRAGDEDEGLLVDAVEDLPAPEGEGGGAATEGPAGDVPE